MLADKSIKKIRENLVKWISGPRWEPYLNEVLDSHFVDYVNLVDFIEEDLSLSFADFFESDDAQMIKLAVMEDFLGRWYGEDSNLNPINDFL